MALSKQRQGEIRTYVKTAKEGKRCADCQQSFPHYVMDSIIEIRRQYL